LKEEALDRTMWRAGFGRGFGPVVRQTAKWMNVYVCVCVCVCVCLCVYIYLHLLVQSNNTPYCLLLSAKQNVLTIAKKVEVTWESGSRCWWRSWLRHCATSRKIATSIPDDVTAIFYWHNPSGRTTALGSTQPFLGGGKGGRCVGLTTLPPSCADCLEIWEPQPPGTLRVCPGLYWDCFTFLHLQFKWFISYCLFFFFNTLKGSTVKVLGVSILGLCDLSVGCDNSGLCGDIGFRNSWDAHSSFARAS
jgi:hypothetical protein